VIELPAAQARVMAAVSPLPPADVLLGDALGLVLAVDVVATEPVPPFANTAMDGYAVRAADTAGAPVELAVVGVLPAGAAPTTGVGPGEAIRIMTGAPMPPGADAIVMVERTEQLPGDRVRIEATAAPGDHVRPAGGDVEPGQVVFTAGTRLRPAHLGVLASLDQRSVRAHRRPRVGVLSTGDELVEHGPLAPGQIRDSNRPMLLAVLAEAGCEPVDLGTARDDEAVITERITTGIDTCDALLTSGAVSVGDYDFVKVAIERLAASRGGEYAWSQVAIKPAKPLAFGVIERVDGRRVPVFGLPGNPVSSTVSFELFARPALRVLAGDPAPHRPVVAAVADQPFARRPDGKLYLDRVSVTLDPEGRFHCARSGFQASNVLSGMANAGGLALVPDGDGVEAGAIVQVMLLW
jgi:molybdenum cofactor synthesis domain-containing protein